MFTSSLWGQELWRNGSTNSKKTREIKNKADISPLVDVCIRLINIQGEILSKTLYTKFTLVYSVSRRRKWTSLKNEILPSELSDARLTCHRQFIRDANDYHLRGISQCQRVILPCALTGFAKLRWCGPKSNFTLECTGWSRDGNKWSSNLRLTLGRDFRRSRKRLS